MLPPLELTAVLTWGGTDLGKERAVSEVMSESTEMVGKEIGQTSFRRIQETFCKGDAECSYQPSTALQEAPAAAHRAHLRLLLLWTCVTGF